jgi:hypothetical protein
MIGGCQLALASFFSRDFSTASNPRPSAFIESAGEPRWFSRNLGDPGPPTNAAVPFSAGNSVTWNRGSADFIESAGEPISLIGPTK